MNVKNAQIFAKGNEIMEWISVKDRLPKEGMEHSYLITDGKEVGYGYLNHNFTDIEEKNLYWIDEVKILKTCLAGWPEVTHWTHLPLPPEEI